MACTCTNPIQLYLRFIPFPYTDLHDCSQALGDPNCEVCHGFDSNGLPVCIRCKAGYITVGRKCEREGSYMCSDKTNKWETINMILSNRAHNHL